MSTFLRVATLFACTFLTLAPGQAAASPLGFNSGFEESCDRTGWGTVGAGTVDTFDNASMMLTAPNGETIAVGQGNCSGYTEPDPGGAVGFKFVLPDSVHGGDTISFLWQLLGGDTAGDTYSVVVTNYGAAAFMLLATSEVFTNTDWAMNMITVPDALPGGDATTPRAINFLNNNLSGGSPSIALVDDAELGPRTIPEPNILVLAAFALFAAAFMMKARQHAHQRSH